MHIVVLLGGKGIRFKKENYLRPKPLINIEGQPIILWLLRSLCLHESDTLHIVYHSDLDKFGFRDVMKTFNPCCSFHIHSLQTDTRGPVETLLSLLRRLGPGDLAHPFITLDGDTFYEDDILGCFRNMPTATEKPMEKTMANAQVIEPLVNNVSNCVFFHETQSSIPMFSYVRLVLDQGEENEEDEKRTRSSPRDLSKEKWVADQFRVTDIKEKQIISSHANTGAYGFSSGNCLIRYCKKVINNGLKSNCQEFYMSFLYNEMLRDDLPVYAFPVKNFYCVGTPSQLQKFFLKEIAGEQRSVSTSTNTSTKLTKTTQPPHFSSHGGHVNVNSAVIDTVVTTSATTVTTSTSTSVSTNVTSPPSLRFCFDLDETLVTRPTSDTPYENVEPIEPNIRILKFLKRRGHTIIIYTARRMKTWKGNVGRVMADIASVTLKTLEKFNIPYDEIYFGKPYADFYVDDKAVNPAYGLDKELGVYDFQEAKTSEIVNLEKRLETKTCLEMNNRNINSQFCARQQPKVFPSSSFLSSSLSPSPSPSPSPPLTSLHGTVPCRGFNQVEFSQTQVFKKSPYSILKGEHYWYTHIPDSISKYFPRLLSAQVEPGNTCSIVLEKVKGPTMSHVYVNSWLTTEGLKKLLNILEIIHLQNPFCNTSENDQKINLYSNYIPKMKARWQKYRTTYNKLKDSESIYRCLCHHLTKYEHDKKAVKGCIHGDPVFTNVIMSSDGYKLVDMRGLLGETCTLMGDCLYDYAKVYQSLRGYDAVLWGVDINPHYQKIMISSFENYVETNLPMFSMDNIKIITASLFFTLIPLHEEQEKHQAYFDLCESILLEVICNQK